MISQAVRWTQTPSATPLQAIKWNAHILIMFNFWWLASLVNGLKPIHQCSPAKKNEMLIFGLCSLLKICLADWWTWTPSATPLQPIKWNAHFWITFNFWCSAGLVNGLEPHPLPVSRQKKEMLIFWLCSTSDDLPGWLMNLNPIYHPSPTKKMKCSIFDYIQLLMISQAGRWTQSPSAIPLQPKKWNAHFWITFNFWWLAGLVDGLKTHPPPLSSQRNEMFIFVLCSTSNDRLGWSMDSNPIHHLSPAKKNEMLSFVLRWTSDDLPGWLRDSNPIHHPSPPKTMKCSFLDYVQLLMIGRAGWWTQTPSTTPLLPKKWNVYFWIMFNFWWSAGLLDGLEPNPPPISSLKIEMLIFWLCSTSDNQPGWSMDSKPICHLSPANKMKCFFQICVHFWWSARLVDGFEPHLPPLSYQKNKMLIFQIHSTSNDQPGWSMASNPICHPSPANKMKCSFWIKFNFWWSARLVDGLKLRSPPFSSQKKWNAHFLIMFNFWWLAGLVDGLKPHPPLLSSQKLKCSFLDYVHFWWLAGLVDEPEPHLPPLSSQKNEMLIFWLHSTSDDQPG